MVNRAVGIVLLSQMLTGSSLAQIKQGESVWDGKLEVTQDQGGRQTYDFQNYGQMGQTSLLIRGFWAEQSVHRFELAAGRTFCTIKFQSDKCLLSLTQYAGMTTDGAIFVPLVANFKFFGLQAYYLADPKLYYRSRSDTLHHDTLYQEASFPVTKSENWRIGWRQLQLPRQTMVFNRFCAERRFLFRGNARFAILPFFDFTGRTVGIYADFGW